MLMLLATIETARAVSNNRHFASAVTTAGDLVAREEYLGTSSDRGENQSRQHDAVDQAYDAALRRYDVKLGVYSVRASSTNAAETKVVWSYSYNGMQVPANCASYSLPANIVGKGGSVIVVDAIYTFKPLFGDFVPGISGAMTWKNKSYHSPRNSCVDYVKGDNCTKSC